MSDTRVSYRNPFLTALLFALLYFVISNAFYWVFNGRLSFIPYHYYEWVEYALGTVTMGVCAFVVAIVRNQMGKRGAGAKGGRSDLGGS